jgi:murein L,D-transpeptidase YafK
MRLAAILLLTLATHALADRVSTVRARRAADVKALVKEAGLDSPVDEAYLRVFKEERQVELWASRAGKPMVLVKTFGVCAASGELGPKRQEGDLQVPEGLYEVSEFNPTSSYHLALKVSYPNASDRVRSDQKTPGGLIYMHGKCASIGCIAIEDAQIEEVYLTVLDARRKPIRIDLFPRRLSAKWLEAQKSSPHAGLWNELWPAYANFEATHRPVAFTVDRKTGAYRVNP